MFLFFLLRDRFVSERRRCTGSKSDLDRVAYSLLLEKRHFSLLFRLFSFFYFDCI